MHSRLDTIVNWVERAQRAGWGASQLASDCGVTGRQLRRYVRAKFRIQLHVWLRRQRLHFAKRLVQDGAMIKAAAVEAGFSHPTNFSRAFKRHFNTSPELLAPAE